MKEGNHSCLVGCTDHNADPPHQPSTLDPEILSYYFVRRSDSPFEQDSDSVSPMFSRTRSYEKSPKSHKSQVSGESSRTKPQKTQSISSSMSISSKYRDITDWSAKISDTTPSSFGPSIRYPVDPPRPARSGLEWVWFPEGYWAEREIRDIIQPRPTFRPKWWNRSPEQKVDLPRIKVGSISLKDFTARNSPRPSGSEDRNSKSTSDFDFVQPITPLHESYPPAERLGLYCRAKRNINERFLQKQKLVRAKVCLIE